jgi:hypothetical protein
MRLSQTFSIAPIQRIRSPIRNGDLLVDAVDNLHALAQSLPS